MRARIGGYLALIPQVARATATWVHASARRWGETWTRSIKIPWFLGVLGGRAYSLRASWHAPGGPWVWSLGLFTPIFFSTSINKKKMDREASLTKKEYRRHGPHPPQVISPRARPPLVKGAGCIAPRTPGAGHPGPWPHCTAGTPQNLHRRPLPAPHGTPRPPHRVWEGTPGDQRWLGQLDM